MIRLLHKPAVVALKLLLPLLVLLALALQLQELSNASELVPLGSFALFLSLAGLTIGWARIGETMASFQQRRELLEVSKSLILAALLIAAAAVLIWAQGLGAATTAVSSLIGRLLLLVHWLLLAMGLVIGAQGMHRLTTQLVSE